MDPGAEPTDFLPRVEQLKNTSYVQFCKNQMESGVLRETFIPVQWDTDFCCNVLQTVYIAMLFFCLSQQFFKFFNILISCSSDLSVVT